MSNVRMFKIDLGRRCLPKIPFAAYGLRHGQLDDWERQTHAGSALVGEFELVREECCDERFNEYDGYIKPTTPHGMSYILGWLYGRSSLMK